MTRMDRKLRATRLKLEQKRQVKYKKNRDAANHTNKTWDQVEKAFFQRLTLKSPTKLKMKENNQKLNLARYCSLSLKELIVELRNTFSSCRFQI